ncbi:DUF6233 domain-containing protein [Streptomyces sp. NPDC048179]
MVGQDQARRLFTRDGVSACPICRPTPHCTSSTGT